MESDMTDPLMKVAGTYNPEKPIPDDEAMKQHLNQEILDKGREIAGQVHVLKERLHRALEKKDEVRASVFERVNSDYQQRLLELKESFLEIKSQIDEELNGLRENDVELSQQAEQHEEVIEEARFRYDLGEYEADEFEEMVRQEDVALEQTKDKQEALQSAIETYESVRIDEDDEVVPIEEASINELGSDVMLESDHRELDEEISANLDVDGPFVAEVSDSQSVSEESSSSLSVSEKEDPADNDSESSSDNVTVSLQVGSREPRAVGKEGEKFPTPSATKAQTSEGETELHSVGLPEGKLRLIEDGAPTTQFVICGEMSIGRAPNNDIVFQESKVSRFHAIAKMEGNSFILTDNESSNGTFVNGEKITQPVELYPGDRINIGSYELEFSF
jgi:pSer/pThr/pTyr-binding forkhead associated (FHA) protein